MPGPEDMIQPLSDEAREAFSRFADIGQPMRALPRYTCHKQVWALKIKSVGTDILQFEDDDYGPRCGFEAAKYITKHNPQPGGYWVQYDDGYESYSPAEAFEQGYTRNP